jgi:hypothetical protein
LDELLCRYSSANIAHVSTLVEIIDFSYVFYQGM